jgi:hypothetical protein
MGLIQARPDVHFNFNYGGKDQLDAQGRRFLAKISQMQDTWDSNDEGDRLSDNVDFSIGSSGGDF